MILRPATAADAAVVAEISTGSRHAAMPTVRWAHTAEEDRWWVANVLLVQEAVWLAEAEGVVAGFLALHGDWVSQLYLRPGLWRRGIGSALLAHAKALRPGGLQLWCFQVNARGRAFYARHGFSVARMTDGAENEEREPDILYRWAPAVNNFDNATN